MSTRRLYMINTIPIEIKAAFKDADHPISREQALWRERAARMTLDALGHTNLTVKPFQHNEAVLYARRWFHGFFEDHPDDEKVDNAGATFDFAGIPFSAVRKHVLCNTPILFELSGQENDFGST